MEKAFMLPGVVELSKKHTLFSWAAQSSIDPIHISRAKGVFFWDGNGKRYIDLNAQLACVNVGHGDERVLKAIYDQAQEVAYCAPSTTTQVRAEVGKVLSELAPGDLNKFFFTSGGGEANENAVRAARLVTGRQKVITRYRSFHGGSLGAISLTGEPRRWANEPGIPGVVRIFDPYKYRSRLYTEGDSDAAFAKKCLDEIREVLMYEGPHTIAAILVETVSGGNGVVIPPEGYLTGLRKICDEHGILLIFDEVLCGLGRTGRWFAADHWGVVPDMITMAKGLTSAYLPLGAVGMSDKVASHFDKNVFFGGLTYNSHPMCLAAAKACLQIMKDDDLCGNSARMGMVLSEILADLKNRHPSVGDVRSIGLLGVVELVRSRKTKEPMAPYFTYNGTSPEMKKMGAFLRDEGVSTSLFYNYIFLAPPLCITESQLREAMAIVDRGLSITDEFVKV